MIKILVNFPVVAGGFALLAAGGVAGQTFAGLGVGAAATPLLAGAGGPLLAGLGLAGAGAAGMGFMMAMEDCMPPLCVAASGQCCLLILTSRGVGCPPSC